MHITEARREMERHGWTLDFGLAQAPALGGRWRSGLRRAEYAWAVRGGERVKLASASAFAQWSMARLGQAIAELPGSTGDDEAGRAAAAEGLPPDAGRGTPHYFFETKRREHPDGDDNDDGGGTPTT